MILSPKFEEALVYASIIHSGQYRKDTSIPTFSHLMGVAGIALDYEGNEDEAIAALLHDACEDCGGQPRLEDIRQRFGDTVAEIVKGCTDTFDDPKPPWLDRKREFIARVPNFTAPIILVCAADKLNNVRAILKDFRAGGDSVWTRFHGPKHGVLGYYLSMARAFRENPAHKLRRIPELVEELGRTISKLSDLAGYDPSQDPLAESTEV